MDGLGAAEWRNALRVALDGQDWKGAAAAASALIALDPGSLSEPAAMVQMASLLVALTEVDAGEADRLANELATVSGGVDALYFIATQRGGTKGAELAMERLAAPEVRSVGSPAVQIALELRGAPCEQKEGLLERVVEVGDARALAVLLALRAPDCAPKNQGCCLGGNERVAAAMRELTARLTPKKPPRARGDDPYN